MTDEFERYCISVADQFLKRVKGLAMRQASAHDALEQQIAIRDALKGIDYSVQKVAGDSPDTRLVETIERIDELIVQYEAALADYDAGVRHARGILARMDDQSHAAILERYYLVGQTWRQVGAAVGYSVEKIYDIRPFALIGFYEAMTSYESGMEQAL